MTERVVTTSERVPVLPALFKTLAWPALAAVSLSVAVGGREVGGRGLLLVAGGTMAAYGLDRLVDRRDLDPASFRRILITCVAMAALFSAVLACSSWWHVRVCLVLGFIAGAYVPLKKFIPKNVLTVLGWTVATSTLPFAGPPEVDAAFHATVATVALIMAANTLICDVPDVLADRAAGVRGIAPFFGARAGAGAAMTFGLIGAVVADAHGRWGLAGTSLSLAVMGATLVHNPKQRHVRNLADAVVTVLPGPLALFLR